MIVENIKAFLKEQGIIWTGYIYKNRKEEFVEANGEDFKVLKSRSFSIDFGKDGMCGVIVEVDDITFIIKGEDFNCPLIAYAGEKDKNVKLLRERDLSKEWIKFQLKSSGLLYAILLKKRVEEEQRKTEETSEKRIKQLDRKIQYLENSKIKIEENKKKKLKEIKRLEKLAEEVENNQE